MSSSLFQSFITDENLICDRCKRTVYKGDYAYRLEEEYFCEDCVEMLEAEAIDLAIDQAKEEKAFGL